MTKTNSYFPLKTDNLTRTARLRTGLARVGSLVLLSLGLTWLLSCGQKKPASEPQAVKGGELQVPDLPTEVGKSVAIDLPGLTNEAKKLELVLVPGLGSVKPFFMGKYEVTQGQYEAVMDAKAACSGTTSSVISTAISSRTPPFSS
jgi:formylglycine-generating enzyme required for sulfatase activity